MSDKEPTSDSQQGQQEQQQQRQDDYNPGRDLPDVDDRRYRKSEDDYISERERENYRTGKE